MKRMLDQGMRFGLVLALLFACGDDGDSSDDTSDETTESADEVTDDAPDAPMPDAAPDSPTGLPEDCTGPCRTTALTATFGSNTRVLDAAYFGFNSFSETIRVEAYNGADPGCPTMQSGTPEQTLIIVTVPIPTNFDTSTSNSSLLDFDGALFDDLRPVPATSTALTPVAYSDQVLAMDAVFEFENGTMAGHFYATHCDSLDMN